MKGFFSKEQTTKADGQMKGYSCATCGLYKYTLSPKMNPYGKFKKGIMVIGEAPGEDEDRRSKPWQGKMGKVLQKKYKQLGIDLFEDCVSLNAINCRPVDDKGANRPPTDQEIACCRSKVVTAIKQYQPKVIILQGGAPLSTMFGDKWTGELGGITKWRGWAIPDREYRAWICPTFHPSYIERQEKESEVHALWQDDLEQAIKKAGEPFPEYKDEEKCIVTTDDIEGTLRKFNTPSMMAFDIETTGLKPYDTSSHQIVSISFCNNEEEAWAIPFPKTKKELKLLKKLLENPEVKKIAANMKYEDNWLTVLHNIRTSPWLFDTMQASHILDNRHGITSLSFQSYVRFGVPEYDQEVSPYLKSSDSHGVNRIMELTKGKASFRKLLLYNGIDSLMTFRLAMAQMKEVGIA